MKKEYSYAHHIDNNLSRDGLNISSGNNSDIEMTDIENIQTHNIKPEQQVDDYYVYILQKVVSSVPDINMDIKNDGSSSDGGDSVNDYSNQTTFNYFNSF